ncbi:MAG TPA: hypothetical protein VHD87_09890 [Acidimicrobiales bacterium]|nr:hypothetical protein [Acidimicrobiales bacterium]HVV36548.1 hypothetical protein [Acidimicrobiales bacterium]
MLVLAAKQWHAWVAFPLMAGAVGVAVGLAGGYIRKVIRPKYPR